MTKKEVTPCVGVWIETGKGGVGKTTTTSHPAWVCGLKLSRVKVSYVLFGHTLRGCVD